MATHAFDTAAIAKLIDEGIARGLTADELAANVVDFIDDPALGRAMNHPVRRAIVRVLRTEGPHSPARTAEKIDAPLHKVAYHFRELAKDGVVEVCDTIPRRGAVEHVYRLHAI